ncbi:MAG: serine protease [Lentisphaeraceae bacterium]|nr:serine protease [Lentisphaeraceae bacterium]
MSSIKAIFCLFLSITISTQGFDEAALIRQTLKELSLLEVPKQVDQAALDEKIKKQVARKFPEYLVLKIKEDFDKAHPLVKVGDKVEYKTRAVSFTGTLTSFDSKYLYVDKKRYHMSSLPQSLRIRFDGPTRASELKKEIYKNYKRPMALHEIDLRDEHSSESDYKNYVKTLNQKKVSYCIKEFDRLYGAVRKSDDKKASIRELLSYYKGFKKYLSSRSSAATKAYNYYNKFDANLVLKELSEALANKANFKAPPLGKQKSIKSIVLIEGDKGVGTGFFVNYYGFKCVISNRHVFVGNESVKLTDTDNNEVPFKDMIVAKPAENHGSSDVMIYTLSEETKALHSFIPVGEKLMVDKPTEVYGNSLGDRVVRSLPGKLRGVGPKVIEVDNEFVPGNSGSPIMQGGYVIGIATYAKVTAKNWSTQGAIFSKVRRFGVKLSAMEISDYSAFDTKRYKKDLAILKPLETSIAKFINNYNTAKSRSVTIEQFIMENQQAVSLIKRHMPYAKKHKFTSVMDTTAKQTLKLGDNILVTISKLNLTKVFLAEQDKIDAINDQISKYSIYSMSVKYYRSTAARKNFLLVSVSNASSSGLKGLTVSITAKDDRTGRMLMSNKRFKLYKSKHEAPYGILQYRIPMPSNFPRSQSDVSFYGGVIDVDYK